MTSIEIAPLQKEHIQDAAGLFAAGYRAARERRPLLPLRYEDPGTVVPLLRRLVEKRPAVAALQGGRPVGYLASGVIPDWRGRRTAFVPFWAHAAQGEQRDRILEDMHSFLSARWADDNCPILLVSVLADDRKTVDALFRLGYGVAVIDAMRSLDPVPEPTIGVAIRRAGLDDRDAFRQLRRQLVDYLSGPPVFLHVAPDKPDEYEARWLGDSEHAVWLAYLDAEPVAYMQVCRLEGEVVVTDSQTAGIQGALTRDDLRGQGIGQALLNRCLDWTRQQGFARCAVDFEGENVLGRRFWLRHFEPVLYSLVRHLDLRVVRSRAAP